MLRKAVTFQPSCISLILIYFARTRIKRINKR